MGKIYLIRHAEPELCGVLLGACDAPLSDEGRAAAQQLSHLTVAMVYCSRLRRAVETARAIPAPCRALPGFNEISFGEWDGKPWSEIKAGDPALSGAKEKNWFEVTPPGGEPWPAFRERVLDALGEVLEGPTPAAIVAHAAVNAVIAEALTGITAAAFQQDYCEVIEVDIEDDCTNRRRHRAGRQSAAGGTDTGQAR